MLVLLLQLQPLQLLLRNSLGYRQVFFLLTGVFLGVWNHENRFPEANITKMVLATTPVFTSPFFDKKIVCVFPFLMLPLRFLKE